MREGCDFTEAEVKGFRRPKSYIPRHKYNAVKTEYDGILFQSKKEGQYYLDLLSRY